MTPTIPTQCQTCGKALTQPARGGPRKTCSRRCKARRDITAAGHRRTARGAIGYLLSRAALATARGETTQAARFRALAERVEKRQVSLLDKTQLADSH